MEGHADPFLLLFPTVLERVLSHLTFCERRTTLYSRSKIWRQLYVHGLQRATFSNQDIEAIVQSQVVPSRGNQSAAEIVQDTLSLLGPGNHLLSLTIPSIIFGKCLKKSNCMFDFVSNTVQSISMDDTETQRNDLVLAEVFKMFTNLTTISISRYFLDVNFSDFSSNLQEVSFKWVKLPEGSLGVLFSKCLKLKILKLEYLKTLPIDIVIPECVQLQELFINYIWMDVLDIKTQKSLKLFHFRLWPDVYPLDILAKFESCRDTLVSLTLDYYSRIKIVGLLGAFTKLRYLDVDVIAEVHSQSELLSEIGCCKALRSLQLKCLDVTDSDAFHDMLNRLTYLTRLRFLSISAKVIVQKARLQPRNKPLQVDPVEV